MLDDFKYALRTLLKAPGFTIIAVLTLTLGIGANSAIFSVIDTVLLRPLAFPHSEQLVMIWGVSGKNSNTHETSSFPDFFDFRAQNQSFSAMAGYTGVFAVLNGFGEAQELSGVAVDGDFFETIGVTPMLGHGFTAEEGRLGEPNVVVLSHDLWKRSFASNPNIVGQQVTMTSRSYTVLGVMPPGWKFPVEQERSEFIMPLESFMPTAVPQRGWHFLRLVGRLRSGVKVQQADGELKAIATRLGQEYPETNADRGAAVMPMLRDIVGDVRPALLVLSGAVTLVLLIACVNIANLLLVRGAARAREMGIRTALGASRARLVRQLFAESLLLALLGAAGGLLLAWWAVDLFGVFGPRDIPRLSDIHINIGVGAFSFAVSILSALVFGVVPALQTSRGNLTEAIHQGARSSAAGLRGVRMRTSFVVAEISLSFLLLASAGLLIRSFFNLETTNVGFDPARLSVIDEALPRSTYSEAEKQRTFYQQLLPRLAHLPGCESVGAANPAPFSGAADHVSRFRVENEPDPGLGHHPIASHVVVTPGYFGTVRIPLRAGRDFDSRDNETAQHVAMVNETFVRRFIPDRNPIGEEILLDGENDKPDALQIVGVVGDAKQNEIGAPTPPEMYQPFAQSPSRRLWIVIRTATENLGGTQSAVRRIFHEQDRDVFVSNIEPMQIIIGRTLAQPRFNMLLLGTFAGVAMILAAIGIYGVIAYTVAQRTKEIGIRMALGAQKIEMMTMVLRQSLAIVGIGLVIGLISALGTTRLISALLFGVEANDVLTYLIVVLLLGLAALLASYLPARRAAMVDPVQALRAE
jgi:putative ABC transport system permease protein